MSEIKFRTKRCTHMLAWGTCEVSICPGAAKNIGSDATVKMVSAPKCSHCKRECADAIHRGPMRISGNKSSQYRYCDQCWTDRQAREAERDQRQNYFDRQRAQHPRAVAILDQPSQDGGGE